MFVPIQRTIHIYISLEDQQSLMQGLPNTPLSHQIRVAWFWVIIQAGIYQKTPVSVH